MATVRQLRLGRTLRQHRENASLKPEHVATELHWDRSKVSRIETARVKAKPADVQALLALYGVTSPDRDALLELARTADRRGWWTAYTDVFTSSYVELEADACLIREWASQVIPGLLETEDYARAVLTRARPADEPEVIERWVQARMARRTLLGKDGAPDLHVVIDEGALRRQVGDRDVMRRQLSYLWGAAQKPNITVQFMPFAAGAHAGIDGRFIVLSFPDEADPDVPYSEGPYGSVYPESAADLARSNLMWDRLTKAALTPQESAEMITALINEE